MKKLFFFASAAALLATSCSDDLGFKQEPSKVVEGNTVLVASYPLGNDGDVETRTTMVPNENSKSGLSYAWTDGDAIGVFSVPGSLTTNSMFSYVASSGTTSADFKGDLMSLEGSNYFGYYPYAAGTALTNSGNYQITLAVEPEQNYNHTAVQNSVFSLNPLSGSFAAGAAPAVAYGTEDNGEIAMKFQPAASYFVVPVQSYTPITVSKVVLEVSGQVIAGELDVNLSPMLQGFAPQVTRTGSATSITLNCGKGVTVGAGDDAVNFWFVVAPGVELAGKTISLSFTGTTVQNGKTVAADAVITKILGTGAGSTESNEIYRILSNAGGAWEYNTDSNNFPITNGVQFIEYLYVMKNTYKAVEYWVDMYNNGGDMSNTYLQDMFEWQENQSAVTLANDVKTSGNGSPQTWQGLNYYVKNFKNALIYNNINVSPTAISQATGINANSVVPNYYQAVYQSYVVNKGFAGPVGNGLVATISGVSPATTVTGLAVNTTSGNGMFAGANEATLNLNSLTLAEAVLNAPNNQSAYYLLANNVATATNGQPFVQFKDVTVASGQINATSTVRGYTQSLLAQDNSNWYTTTTNAQGVPNALVANYTSVTNNTSYLFANNLYINSSRPDFMSYDFTPAGHQVANFGTITVEGYEKGAKYGFGAILNVPVGEAYAKALMDVIVTNGNPYSVIDGATSYWTGTSSTAANATYGLIGYGTAEALASFVQDANGEGGEFDAVYDLDLMGSYAAPASQTYRGLATYWWTNGVEEMIVNGGKEGFTISNVLINGTKDGKNSAAVTSNPANTGTVGLNYMTLFGNYSVVTNLNVNNIQLVPSENADGNLVVAAISMAPSTTDPTSNVNVEGLNVDVTDAEADFVDDTVGGLYFRLDESVFTTTFGTAKVPVLSGLTVNKVTGYTDGLGCGYLAGSLQYNVTGTSATLTNPCSMAGHTKDIFGFVEFTIDGQSGATTTVNFNNFGSNFVTVDNVNEWFKATNGVYNTYYLEVNQDGNSLLFRYNKNAWSLYK